MLGDPFNLNMGIKICGKGIGLVVSQVIMEAYSRVMNGYALHPLYTHISVRACERASVRSCRRAGVRAWTKMNSSVE